MSDAHEQIILPHPTLPRRVAQTFVATRHTPGDALTLLYWRGDFWSWSGSHWKRRDLGEIEAELYEFTGDAFYANRDDEPKQWAPNARRIHDVVHALKAVCRVPDALLQPPCWLDERSLGSIIPCRNGLLVLDGRTLLPHTPQFFNLHALPYDYDPDARCPVWDGFVQQLWPGDEEPACALEEFLGCIVANKTDLHRILVLVGPPRSGKSTILKVIENLVGLANAVAIQLLKLTDDKTLSSLIGKSVCLIPDIRATGGKMPEIAEVLLSISGQDSFTIDRKYKDPWSGSLNASIVTASNEFPTLRDASGALPARYLPIMTTESFQGREDRTLQPRLLAELPGILNRALDGLAHVIKTGRFTEPRVSVEAVEDMAEMASPMKRFAAELLAVMPKGGDPAEYTTPVMDLFRVYRVWGRENDEPPISRETFGQRLRAAVPTIRRSQPRGEGGKRISSYAGVRLQHRETALARAQRLAHDEMAQRAGSLRVIKGGSNDNSNA